MLEKRTIGSYQILEKIGRGGTADVYKGLQSSLNRFVAIKILSPEFVDDEKVLARFRREKDAIAALAHPNIIRIYEYFEEDGFFCYVMEYLPHKTLDLLLREQGRIDPDRAIEITIMLLSALEYAHDNAIIHRDIKPANLFIDDAGNLTLTDFGLAKQINKSSDLTQTRTPIGTPYYMAPEQVRGMKTDERTDIYQVGVVLYHMVTGHVPFPGRTPYEVTMKCLNEKLAFSAEDAEKIGPSLRAAIVAATSKKMQDRYQTAAEMKSDLEKIQKGQAAGVGSEYEKYYASGLKNGVLICRALDMEVPLVKSSTFIGRGPGVEITLPDPKADPKVAMIRFSGGQYILIGSNKDIGMTVNGDPVFGKDKVLEDGDRISVLGFDFLFIDPR